MKHASIFSGIGAAELAAQWMGWDNVFHCEINKFGQKVLKYYFPNSISYEDIKTTDFTIHRGRIDVLTGGFPCQPFSVAGLAKGDEDERHLWPEFLRAIREIKPPWVVGENVRGLVSWNGGLVFEKVQADLEAEGYEVQPYVLPAAGVNAPHKRYRVWFVAYAKSYRGSRGRGNSNWAQQDQAEWKNLQQLFERPGKEFFASYPNSRIRRSVCRYEARKRRENEKYGVNSNLSCDEHVTNSTGFRGKQANGKRKSRFGNESGQGDYWRSWPTQSPVCDGNDGISSRLDGITFPKWRTESIKAAGNAIVPQVIHQIFKAIQEYENLFK